MMETVSETIRERVLKRLKDLREEGTRLAPVSEQIDPDIPPKWFDKARFLQSQQAAQKYYISVNVSHLVGLMLGLQLPLALVPLLSTGRSANVSCLFRRYQSTQIRVKKWYEEDPYDKTTEAYRSVRAVRKMHQNAYRSMNEKEDRVSGKDRVWISQCEMAMTQWAFVGILVLHPEKCGLHGAKRDVILSILYLWRVYGYLNGVEDRFNLCDGSWEEIYLLYDIILKEVFIKPLLESADPVGTEMTKGLTKALRPIVPTLRWQTFVHYWYENLGIPIQVELTDWKKRLRYREQRFILLTLLKYSAFHFLLGRLLRANIWLQDYRKRKTEKRLRTKYPDLSYEQQCPYNLDTLVF